MLADIDPRNAFLPPVLHVPWLARSADGARDTSDWLAIPLLTDGMGEEISRPNVRIFLALDDQYLHLHATIPETKPTLKVASPEHAHELWWLDHLELRLQPESAAGPGDAIQLILAITGATWDSQGLSSRGAITAATQVRPDSWSAQLRVEREAAGLNASVHRFRGLVAHARWAEGFCDFVANSPVELGFAQQERWGTFVIQPRGAIQSPVQLRSITPEQKSPRLGSGVNTCRVHLRNTTAAPVSGRLQLLRESLDETAVVQHEATLTLPVGESAWQSELLLDRPRLRRFTWRWCTDDNCVDLGSFTLRAAPPWIVARPSSRVARPSMMFTAATLEKIRNHLSDPILQSLPVPQVNAAVADAPPPADPPEKKHAHTTSRNLSYVGAVERCLTRWVLSGASDASWIALSTRFVRAALQHTIVGPHTDLLEGNAVAGLALAYDAFFSVLDDDARRDWRELLSRFLEQYLHTARHRLWQVTAIPNANPVCNSVGGLLALALLDEHPEAPEALYLARKLIRTFVDYCHGSDGGNTEGAQYWQYGLESLLPFITAMQNALGTDDGLLDEPMLRLSTNMVRAGLCNDGAIHGVNDTIPLPVGRDIAWLTAAHHHDELAAWYGDHCVRWAQSHEHVLKLGAGAYAAARPWSIVYCVNSPRVSVQPPLPGACVLRDVQVGLLRSGLNVDCRWTAGLKGSRPPYTHHNQADTGSFFVDLRGRRMVIDPGYFKPQARDHALPVIDGVAPGVPRNWVGEIFFCSELGDLRVLGCDSTRAYHGAALRVRRWLLIAGQEAVVLLDDIAVAPEKAGQVESWFQCGGAVELEPEHSVFHVLDPHASLRVECFHAGHSSVTLHAHPERSLHDTHWGYHFADCRLFPVTVRYAANQATPMVTVMSDVTENKNSPRARIEQTSRELRVILGSGRTIDFMQTEQAWELRS